MACISPSRWFHRGKRGAPTGSLTCLVKVLLLPADKAAGNVHIAVGGEELAAGAVKVAGDGQQGHHCPVVLKAVAVVAEGGRGLVAADPGVLVDEPGGGLHLLIGNAGKGLDVPLVEARRVGGVLLEAVDVFFDVGPVDPSPLDEDVGDGQGQGAVGAGAGLEEEVGQLFAGGGAPGIHDEELESPLLQLHGPLGPHVGGVEGVKGPAQEEVASLHVRAALPLPSKP
jgi:hypothetical protein